MRSWVAALLLAVAPVALAQEDDWGFDDDSSEPGEPSESAEEAADGSDVVRFWDLTGDLSLGTSYNFLDHKSATGTGYGNLSRLRAQLDLQLDLDLPLGWKSRIEGYGFYDFAYLARGRSRYTDEVIEDYEWEVDFREVWLQGSPLSSLDIKLGRQIVNWGRSDTVRVLDVVNPLDNREPGLVDIEDLRLPVTMARVDYYPRWIPDEYGDWSVQFLVIPEFRQDRSPSIGNDFNPSPVEIDLPTNKPDRFFDDEPEYGGSVTGTFSGWDLSVYAGRFHVNRPLVTVTPLVASQRYAMFTLVGGGGNLTTGSWLFKGELAWLDNLEYNSGRLVLGLPPFATRIVDKSRFDAMVGVEYYGVNDLQLAFEVVHRHIIDYDETMKFRFGGFQLAYAEEDVTEGALRITADFLNSRLQITGVGIVFLAGGDRHEGSVVRAEASYDLIDALSLGGGIVIYQEGENDPGFNTVGKNDRLFLRIEYSF